MKLRKANKQVGHTKRWTLTHILMWKSKFHRVIERSHQFIYWNRILCFLWDFSLESFVFKRPCIWKVEHFLFNSRIHTFFSSNLVDPASSHTLVSKIKPCMCKYKRLYTVKLRTAHYISYSLFDKYLTTWITVVILELIHAPSPDLTEGMYLLDINHLASAVFGES